MIYSKCLYLVRICADDVQKAKFPLTRATISSYVRCACQRLGCNLLGLVTGKGYVLLLTDLRADISLNNFIATLKNWSSSWIFNRTDTTDAGQFYWQSQCYFRNISPEDGCVAAAMIESSGSCDYKEVITKYDMHVFEKSCKVCHHIVLLTSRYRWLLRVKYKWMLVGFISELAPDLGIDISASSAMRNHVHILCYTPVDVAIAEIIDGLQKGLLKIMHANIHFRKFDGWADESLIYTVSKKRIKTEEREVLNQDLVHGHVQMFDEMHFISERLNTRFITSLV